MSPFEEYWKETPDDFTADYSYEALKAISRSTWQAAYNAGREQGRTDGLMEVIAAIKDTDTLRGCCNQWEHCDCLDIAIETITKLKDPCIDCHSAPIDCVGITECKLKEVKP